MFAPVPMLEGARTVACSVVPISQAALQPLLPAVFPTIGFSLPGLGASGILILGLAVVGCSEGDPSDPAFAGSEIMARIRPRP